MLSRQQRARLPAAASAGRVRLRAVCLAGAALMLVAALVSSWLAADARRCDWILVDLSRSHLAGRSGAAEGVRAAVAQAAAEARSGGAGLELVFYGDGARRVAAGDGELAAAAAREVLRAAALGGEGQSDLGAALHLVAARDDGRARRVLVLGDGGGDGPQARAAAAELAAQGARLELAPAAARDGSCAELLALRVAPRVPSGARVQAVASVAGVHASGEEIRLVARRADGLVLAQVEVPPAALAWRRDVLLDLGSVPQAGVLECVVEAQVVAGGRVLRASPALAVRVASGDTVLVDVCGVPEDAERVLALCADAGLSARRVVPGQASELGDVLVECDPTAGTSLAARALAQGAGVVQLLGARCAAAGAVPGGALRPGAPRAPQRELHVLLDLSGSMSGAPARAASRALSDWLDRLGPGRELAVHPFAARLGPALRWSAAAPPALEAPRGPTALAESLRELLEKRLPAGALLVVVSDGEDGDPAGALASAARLREAAARRGVRTVAVAAGAEPDRALLAALCGAPVLDAGDLATEGAVERLTDALQEASGGEARVQLAQAAPLFPADETLGRSLAAAWTAAAAGWRAEPADGARALLAWRLAQGDETCFAALRDEGSGRVLSVAAASGTSGGALDTPAGLAAAVLAVRGARERPRLHREGARLVLEGAADAPAHLLARVLVDGAEAGSIELQAPAQARSTRQGDWTALRTLAAGGTRVELAWAGAGGGTRSAPLLCALEPEAPPEAPFVPPAPEEVSLSRLGAPARGLVLVASVLLLAALLAPWIKGRAAAGR